MSVNTELSALLIKMGGTPLESDSNSDLIKKISNAYEGGGGGSGGGVTIVHVDMPGGSFDMTAGEVFAAAQTGLVILVETYGGDPIAAGPIGMCIDEAGNYVTTKSADGTVYGAATADAYPEVGGNDGGEQQK